MTEQRDKLSFDAVVGEKQMGRNFGAILIWRRELELDTLVLSSH